MKLVRAVAYSACTLFLVLLILCIVSEMSGPAPSVVYASEKKSSAGISSQQTAQSEMQYFERVNHTVEPVGIEEYEESSFEPCLEGVLGCVSSIREYDHAVQALETTGPGEEILVGAKTVSRSLVDRNAFIKGVMKAGELGYSALQAIAENQMSYKDYHALLQIVEAEATGGDVYSKMLVANVVLNRTQDSHFPDTIYDVIWQRLDGVAQFSPTADGRIYSCTITKSTIEAVERVLNGEDHSQGALFFVARSSANSENLKWFDETLVKLFEYGGHEYSTFREYVGVQTEEQTESQTESQTD